MVSHTHTHGRNTYLHTHTLAQTAVSVHTHVYLLGFPTHTHTPHNHENGDPGSDDSLGSVGHTNSCQLFNSAFVQKQAGSTHLRAIHTQNNTITNTGPTTHTLRHNLGLKYADAQVAGATPHRTPLRNHYHRRPPPQAPPPRPRRHVTTRCRGCWEM